MEAQEAQWPSQAPCSFQSSFPSLALTELFLAAYAALWLAEAPPAASAAIAAPSVVATATASSALPGRRSGDSSLGAMVAAEWPRGAWTRLFLGEPSVAHLLLLLGATMLVLAAIVRSLQHWCCACAAAPSGSGGGCMRAKPEQIAPSDAASGTLAERVRGAPTDPARPWRAVATRPGGARSGNAGGSVGGGTGGSAVSTKAPKSKQRSLSHTWLECVAQSLPCLRECLLQSRTSNGAPNNYTPSSTPKTVGTYAVPSGRRSCTSASGGSARNANRALI